jgi:uncharacterized repeat protein (TIGR03803 family)
MVPNGLTTFLGVGLVDLYGTTNAGGTRGCIGGCGTVLTINPSTGGEKVIYSFCSQSNCADGSQPNAGLVSAGDVLYGTSFSGGAKGIGTVFSINPKTGAEKVLYSFCSQTNCTDGGRPEASLIDANGTLYGTTYYGGANGGGTVFSINPGTGAETVLYSFCSQTNCTDGSEPAASLIEVNGTLYGTTAQGGTYNKGTVYSIASQGG